MGRQFLLALLTVAVCASPSFSFAEEGHASEQVQVSPPPVRRAEAPAANATVADLEQRGNTLRVEKA